MGEGQKQQNTQQRLDQRKSWQLFNLSRQFWRILRAHVGSLSSITTNTAAYDSPHNTSTQLDRCCDNTWYWDPTLNISLCCPPLLTPYSLTLVNLQLDAQNSYLFTYNTFIKILYMFRALPCSSSGGLRRKCIYAASGIVTVCKWLSCALVKKELFLNRCTGQSPADSDDTRGCIYTITT